MLDPKWLPLCLKFEIRIRKFLWSLRPNLKTQKVISKMASDFFFKKKSLIQYIENLANFDRREQFCLRQSLKVNSIGRTFEKKKLLWKVIQRGGTLRPICSLTNYTEKKILIPSIIYTASIYLNHITYTSCYFFLLYA